MPSTIYDVTTWTIPGAPATTAADDIGAVINSIIADIKVHQPLQSSKPGAVIYVPPGDYSLKTRVVIDISYLQIKGSGHGFTSSSIRYNAGDTTSWAEVWPGGSRIRVENTDGTGEAFLIQRSGSPRLSSIELIDFCLDGVSFGPHQNSYLNGKTGVRSTTDTDSLRINGVGMVYLEHGVVISGADALALTNNFIAECGNCVELVAAGQACSVSGNHFGAGPYGYTVYAEGHKGLLVTGNNFFPRGKSLVHMKNSTDCSVTANRLHGFYAGMLTFESGCSRNLVQGNHFLRDVEGFAPFQSVPHPEDDLFGLIHLRGNDNTLVGNHFTIDVPAGSLTPAACVPTIVLVKSGSGNYLSSNHHVASVPVRSVVLDSSTRDTKVLDCGSAVEFEPLGGATYGFRATP